MMRSDRYREDTDEPIIPDYSDEPKVEPVYEDIADLESAPIPSYKEERKYEEIEDEVAEVDADTADIGTSDKLYTSDISEIKSLAVEDEEKKESKSGRLKRYGKKIMMISSIFIPGLIVLLVISSHSTLLINKTVSGAVIFLLGIFLGLFAIGLFLYLKKLNAKKSKKMPNWARAVYGVFVSCYVVGCCAFVFILYGPSTAFRDWLVTTAMATMNHQYICKWFYSAAEIDEVFSRNYFKETGESTNVDLININTDTIYKETYANEYEEAILKRNPEDVYKLIEFEVNGCNAYLAVIYDPSKVRVTTTNRICSYGQYVVDMAKREKALVAINGAGFRDPGHSSTGSMPRGITIVDGKIVTNNQYGAVNTGGIIGFTNDNKLVLLKNTTAQQAVDMGVRDAVSWGPFLIVNGTAGFSSGNGGWGYAARTAIGQRADGIVLLLVVDSNYNRTKGADMQTLTKIMQQYGAVNAANLDGGTSSVMAINGELISHPIDSALNNKTRPIATAFVVSE